MNRRWIALGVTVMVAGCQRAPAPPYPDWVSVTHDEAVSSETAYAGYCRAAQLAETNGGELIDAVTFTPGRKKALRDRLRPALQHMRVSAHRKVLGYRFVPFSAQRGALYTRGWSAIGRVWVWDIEEKAKKGQYSEAISDTLASTKFGFDLMAGSAFEASLGLTLSDNARRALTPYLSQMGARQLGQLSQGLESILEGRPRLEETLRNERLNMLAGVQSVQDAYKTKNFEGIEGQFGTSVQKAVAYLKNVKSERDRVEYFKGFADEAERVSAFWIEESRKPADERRLKDGLIQLEMADKRPWWRFSVHYFGAPQPLVEQFDSTIARSRLFALETAILGRIKTRGLAPESLDEFAAVNTDPYNGKSFAYHRNGSAFRVYSVGANFQDDGGETDETYSGPDVRLERPS